MRENVNGEVEPDATPAEKVTRTRSLSKTFLSELVRDLIGQSWTVLGLVVAYLVLEGSAKALTGNLILITLVVWILTFPLRHKRD